MSKILCIDHDHRGLCFLRDNLTREGFDVAVARTNDAALPLIHDEKLDLIIFSALLLDVDALRLLSSLRSLQRIPIVVYACSTDEETMLAAFRHGADDYVVQQGKLDVLVWHVKAILRRAEPKVEPAFPQRLSLTGEADFDTTTNQIIDPDNRAIQLTRTEGLILQLLSLHREQVFSAERIIECVRGYDHESNAGVIRSHIQHLREKIACLPGHPELIHTVPGVGYMLSTRKRKGGITASGRCYRAQGHTVVEATATRDVVGM